MAIRFRKTKKILPGVKLNISKSGVSATLGVRGASVNVGKNGVYRNLGIPGTGLSKRDKLTFAPNNSDTSDVEYSMINQKELNILADYLLDGEICKLNISVTKYYPMQNAIWGYCLETEQESVFYLSEIKRVFDVNLGNEVENFDSYFSQLNDPGDDESKIKYFIFAGLVAFAMMIYIVFLH